MRGSIVMILGSPFPLPAVPAFPDTVDTTACVPQHHWRQGGEMDRRGGFGTGLAKMPIALVWRGGGGCQPGRRGVLAGPPCLNPTRAGTVFHRMPTLRYVEDGVGRKAGSADTPARRTKMTASRPARWIPNTQQSPALPVTRGRRGRGGERESCITVAVHGVGRGAREFGRLGGDGSGRGGTNLILIATRALQI